MDERGVDGVSLREVRLAAGHKNPSAVQYHFGNRDSLIRAMVFRRIEGVDAERIKALDAVEAEGRGGDLRAVIKALIDPMLDRLDHESGRRFWRLAQQLAHHPGYRNHLHEVLSLTPGIERGRVLIVGSGEMDHLAPLLRVERAEQVVGLVIRSLAERAQLLDMDQPLRPLLPSAAFRANIVDTVEAVLRAPSTAESA
jgi:AcrR family transcriptional regulator